MRTRPPRRPTRRGGARKPASGRARRRKRQGRRWLRVTAISAAVVTLVMALTAVVLWQAYGRIIDARLANEDLEVPRFYGRPFELAVGRGLTPEQLIQRLNDVGYAARAEISSPGQFVANSQEITVGLRAADDQPARTIRVEFSSRRSPVVTRMTDADGGRIRQVTLEAPLLATLVDGEKRRHVPLAGIPQHQIDAVLAIEDRRFYDHPGVDVIRAVGALVTNLRGDRPYLVGGSTLTQQIVKNTFLTPEKTIRRKLQEQFMALVLETRLTKDQLLELYMNDVVLGQRGPFEIHGVSEAARLFFGKHISNVTLPEAATIAGVIQAPSSLSPFRNPERARDRRNLVLSAMAEVGSITPEAATAAADAPLEVTERALENEAPYFVDYVKRVAAELRGETLDPSTGIDVHTTLDLHLQRMAQEAVDTGLDQVDALLEARDRGPAQAALVAVDPRTGEILAFVGGRAYSQTQFNRAVAARRQPGSVFKPFVYLSAFERMAEEGRADITPASVVLDEPTTFQDGDEEYEPSNYQNQYEGPITLRRALAMSRNIVAVKVAEITGYDYVADLWQRVGVGAPAMPYPSIALGVFEASPLELAEAYTIFVNNGSVLPLRAINEFVVDGEATEPARERPRRVARPDTTYLVTNLMKSVMNEGTGYGARAAGFSLEAAGKSGTTNDLRDAWFIGFTPELLTVVWVGLDDNEPIGLGGSQAALPIWTTFMNGALAARPNVPFDVPDGIVTVDIDPETGMRATPRCPRVFEESFLAGTAPRDYCYRHGGRWRRFQDWVGRIIR